MKTTKIYTAALILALVFAQATATFAQSVGINEDGSEPDSSAILDLKSCNRGFLPPRLTDSEISNIPSPEKGLIVYSIDAGLPLMFNGNNWIRMTTGSAYFTSGPDVSDIDGNVYSTIQIGDQLWMTENLKTTTYNDGTSIDLIENDSAWNNDSTGAYCWYDNDEETYSDPYGAIYNWNAVSTGKLCPDGWHVPSDEEWKTLEMELGMSQAQADGRDERGFNEGSQLAGNDTLWPHDHLRDNNLFGSSGFKALPGGGRLGDEFYYMGVYGCYCSTTSRSQPNNSYFWCRIVTYNKNGILRNSRQKDNGWSVRCLKN